MTDPAALHETLEELAADARADGAHLSADDIVAYADGALAASRRAAAADHLAACAECTALLLDLEELRDPATAEEEAPELAVAAMWRRVRDRAVAEGVPAPAAASLPVRRPAPWLPALAATLACATVGLGLWAVSLERRLEESSLPQVNVPVVDLRTIVARSLPAGAEEPPVIEPGARLFTLVVTPTSRQDFADYEAALARAGGLRVWTHRGLRKNSYGTFSMTLSRDRLPAGTYRLSLAGIAGARKEPLGEYTFEVKAP